MPLRRRLLALLLLAASVSHAVAAATFGGKEIYGADDRLDLYGVTEADHLQWAGAVCGLVLSSQLTIEADGSYTLQTRENLLRGPNDNFLPPCDDERFAGQMVAPFCTAFLAAPDRIITAGHCASPFPIEDLRAVFGYELDTPGAMPQRLAARQVYTVVEEMIVMHSRCNDFAVLRLDRAVEAVGAYPLPLAASDILPGTPVGAIGHPLGLPKKVTFGPETRVLGWAGERFFTANFDASGGNSGSPVFDALSGEVVGIYVYSEHDDVVFSDGCWRQLHLPDEEGGQGVTKIALAAPYVDLPAGDGLGPVRDAACTGCRALSGGRGASPFDGAPLWAAFLLLMTRARRRGKQ